MIKKTVKTVVESPVTSNVTDGVPRKEASLGRFTWICNKCGTENTHKQSSSGIYNCTNCGTEIRDSK